MSSACSPAVVRSEIKARLLVVAWVDLSVSDSTFSDRVPNLPRLKSSVSVDAVLKTEVTESGVKLVKAIVQLLGIFDDGKGKCSEPRLSGGTILGAGKPFGGEGWDLTSFQDDTILFGSVIQPAVRLVFRRIKPILAVMYVFVENKQGRASASASAPSKGEVSPGDFLGRLRASFAHFTPVGDWKGRTLTAAPPPAPAPAAKHKPHAAAATSTAAAAAATASAGGSVGLLSRFDSAVPGLFGDSIRASVTTRDEDGRW